MEKQAEMRKGPSLPQQKDVLPEVISVFQGVGLCSDYANAIYCSFYV